MRPIFVHGCGFMVEMVSEFDQRGELRMRALHKRHSVLRRKSSLHYTKSQESLASGCLSS